LLWPHMLEWRCNHHRGSLRCDRPLPWEGSCSHGSFTHRCQLQLCFTLVFLQLLPMLNTCLCCCHGTMCARLLRCCVCTTVGSAVLLLLLLRLILMLLLPLLPLLLPICNFLWHSSNKLITSAASWCYFHRLRPCKCRVLFGGMCPPECVFHHLRCCLKHFSLNRSLNHACGSAKRWRIRIWPTTSSRSSCSCFPTISNLGGAIFLLRLINRLMLLLLL